MSTAVLNELAPVAERLVERHVSTAKEWFPHDLIPFERGRARSDAPWQETDADMGGATLTSPVRSALFVNLLTEDNLPHYFLTLHELFGAHDVWGEWTRRWTAEEGRHSMAIYGYLMATRAVDPVSLERGRMRQVSGGHVPKPKSVLHGLAYVALQELATRIAHRNTGKLIGDPVGYELMARVAADENLHYLFYRDLASAALELEPSAMIQAICDEVREFEMPGTGIPDFGAHAKAISKAGIYDVAIHHAQILVPVIMNHWKLDTLSNLTAVGEKARDTVVNYIDRVGKVGRRLMDRRAEATSHALT